LFNPSDKFIGRNILNFKNQSKTHTWKFITKKSEGQQHSRKVRN
jgi:hypothetical protein